MKFFNFFPAFEFFFKFEKMNVTLQILNIFWKKIACDTIEFSGDWINSYT